MTTPPQAPIQPGGAMPPSPGMPPYPGPYQQPPKKKHRPGKRASRLRLALAFVIAAAAALAPVLAAQPASAASWTEIYSGYYGTNVLHTRVLTPDGSDSYSIIKSRGQVTMAAKPGNTDGNLRDVFWPSGTPALANAQVCATWKYESSSWAQEGLAVRINGTPRDTFAITVTKNVWAGAYWDFNVHTWDTASSQPFTQIAQFDYSNVVIKNSTRVPFPWRACARVVGSTLTFKLWVPAVESTPSWTDPTYVRSTTVPSKYLAAGETGWYVGHIPPGGSMRYGNLEIWAYR